MHHATVVRVRQRFGQLKPVAHDFLGRQRPISQPSIQRLPLDHFHRDVGVAVCFTDFVNRADVRMIERRGRTGFKQQPRAPPGVVGELPRKHLEGDIASELRIVRAIHFAHPARAEPRQNLVGSQLPFER